MKIISHRGYWREAHEKNQPVAFHRSFDLGFGTETDIRDSGRELVIAHDMPSGREIKLTEMLDILAGRDLTLAVNIKADGLARALAAIMNERRVTGWFTFDMSFPETLIQSRIGVPFFTRVSDYERTPLLYEPARGVWLDAFDSDWYGWDDVETFLRDSKQVCLVSPELHARPYRERWESLARSSLRRHPSLILCTDLPEEAQALFGDAA